ncbi:pilus assembly protein [Novosphingobium sp. 1949]|uniref:Pilus assembly protein n=1 Tax=Novosphingobium organovorum TaxID=2930092 RepID=A0ABT0BCT5_9SPHN|nr:TadE/TadG family type IV pilus assembly protein [Novosphingobium organovorum]MCJ2182609.1 pilus assembly protein [Novosphingobium organovorum]
MSTQGNATATIQAPQQGAVQTRARGAWCVLRTLAGNRSGAVLVEAALALPVLISLLLGVVTYGAWFMSAHSLQQVANEAARASVAGLDATERRQIVDATIAKSVLSAGTIEPDLLNVETGIDGAYYRVTLSYDVAHSTMFANSLVPLPGDTITREATVQLPAL